ncbi:MAG: four helix bundle protein [Bacteroidota bacterium]
MSGGTMGKRENVVRDKSFVFAVRIVYLFKRLSGEKREFVLSRQILKSGTSIGANVEEADNAISKRDFSGKISIAYKEAKETQYWLRLLLATGYIAQNEFDSLISDCDELCRLLFSILRTSRINLQ